MADIGEKIGQTLVGALPTPTSKPFSPPYGADDPRSESFQFHYNISPHDLGDTIRKNILGLQKNLPNSNIIKRPMARYGAEDASTRILNFPGGLASNGRRVGGLQIPVLDEETAGPVYDVLKSLGEIPRLSKDLIVMPSGRSDTWVNLKHEFTHRAFRKLNEAGKIPEGFSDLGLSEEDLTRLLDYVSGDNVDKSEWWFSKSSEWKKTPTHPEELLKRESVLNFLMAIQREAAKELEKSGIKVPIHFPQE